MAQFEKPFGSTVIRDLVCRLRCEMDTSGLHVRSVMNRPKLIGNTFFDPHPVPNTQKYTTAAFLQHNLAPKYMEASLLVHSLICYYRRLYSTPVSMAVE
jgi:hypothetical protein